VSRLLWGRRFERLCLAILVGLYLLGFHTSEQRDGRIEHAATQAREAASQAKSAAAGVARLAAASNHALCALRHDLEDRVANGERFLRKNPRGIPGIPARTLRQSIGGQRRTIRALSDLKCR
jgi:hypothetical protein